MHKSPPVHHVKQLLSVSEEDQTLLPLHHPCSPFMLLAGHSCCGKGRVGVQDPIAECRGSMVDPLCTQLPVLHAQGGTEGASPWCACEARRLWLLLHPVAVPGQQMWRLSPALMRVAARCGCCWWLGGTAASLQRLKTHFQWAAGAGVGISLPWHGHNASLAAACWGSSGWGGGGDCLHACAYNLGRVFANWRLMG